MSNKKRIQKRIGQIERLQLVRFAKAFEKSAVQAEIAGAAIARLLNIVTDHNELLKRRLQIFNEYQMGSVFNLKPYDPEFENFALNMRKLTGCSEAEVKNLCISLPKEHWKTCEGLVSVGFSLEDAVDEIIDAYKLMTHCS